MFLLLPKHKQYYQKKLTHNMLMLAVLDELAKDLAAPEPSSRRERSASEAKVITRATATQMRAHHGQGPGFVCAELADRLAEEKGREC